MAKWISLEGIPEPLARAIEVVVEAARNLTPKDHRNSSAPVPEFPRWEGRVIGSLSRSEIYDDR